MDVAVAGKILAVEGITVVYGRTEVLRDVSIEVTPGQLLAVTGPSGAGKTTLLSAMAGLIRPIRGAVRFGGNALRDRDHAVAEGVVIVPQDNGLAPILTAAENVQVVLIACGVNPPEARRRTVEALERVGLAEQADQLVEELSGGQQQRTALARGLALRGAVLLADEVTSELDAQNRQRVARPAPGRGRPWCRGRLRHPRPRGRRRVRCRSAPARRQPRDGASRLRKGTLLAFARDCACVCSRLRGAALAPRAAAEPRELAPALAVNAQLPESAPLALWMRLAIVKVGARIGYARELPAGRGPIRFPEDSDGRREHRARTPALAGALRRGAGTGRGLHHAVRDGGRPGVRAAARGRRCPASSGSAGRASTRTPGACTPPATAGGPGPSGSSPASATPSRPTSGTR